MRFEPEVPVKCPIDARELMMSDRQGIEIDYCPTCRGVWLDRGELDKIIERSAPEAGDGQAHDEHRSSDGNRGRDRHDDDLGATRSPLGKKKRKREGFLGELFEFGG